MAVFMFTVSKQSFLGALHKRLQCVKCHVCAVDFSEVFCYENAYGAQIRIKKILNSCTPIFVTEFRAAFGITSKA